jgi:hypothetical protein
MTFETLIKENVSYIRDRRRLLPGPLAAAVVIYS